MKLEILRNVEYAGALKDALALRRIGIIDSEMNDQIGIFCWNIAQWSIARAVKSGKLWRTFSQDADFQSDVCTSVLSYVDKVSLERSPKEILVYLMRVASSAINDRIKRATRAKRRHEECGILEADISADFYGQVKTATYKEANEWVTWKK